MKFCLVSTKTIVSFTKFTIDSRRKTTKNSHPRFEKNSSSFVCNHNYLAVSDARKNNNHQLGILREILFNERDVNYFYACFFANDGSLG